MKVTHNAGRAFMVSLSAGEVRGLSAPLDVSVRIDSLLTCTVDAAHLYLFSRTYRAGDCIVRREGPEWVAATMPVLLTDKPGAARQTVAATKAFAEIASRACEYVSQFDVFAEAALTVERTAAANLTILHRREVDKLARAMRDSTERAARFERIARLPDGLTADEHRIAAALVANGLDIDDAVLASKALS